MQMCPFCDKVYDESEYSHCPYCHPYEDKYDALVEEKLAEIQAYKEEQDRKNKEAKENI